MYLHVSRRAKPEVSFVVFLILLITGAVTLLCPVALPKEKGKTDMPSARYAVVREQHEGLTVYVLQDQEAGCEARVIPEFGNNCFSYSFDVDGERIDIIDPPDSLATLKGRASGYGVPILFPFPNRIREGKFSFEGKDYQFDIPAPGANSIHGLVLNRPWKVEEAEADDENGARLVSSIKCADFPDAIRQYPFPFNLEQRFFK